MAQLRDQNCPKCKKPFGREATIGGDGDTHFVDCPSCGQRTQLDRIYEVEGAPAMFTLRK